MCGIAGIFKFGKNRDHLNEAILRSMSDTLEHRGPDDEGFYCDIKKGIGLAHKRLSIIDLASGRQPLWNEDHSIAVVFNGEIYNYIELRLKLEKSHQFETQSDTEVLLHLYEDKDVAMLEELNGMFAFAIWDSKKRRIFMARDRVGIKPVYFTTVNESFIFGSEIKALLKYPGVKKTVNNIGYYFLLSLRCVPAPLTIFENIFKLQAGHYLTVDVEKGVSQQHDYWNLEEKIADPLTGKNKNQHVENLKELFDSSVQLRMRSDVPIGSFLSGGIDSSLIVGLMNGISEIPISTFSVGFKDKGYSELDFAEEVAKKFSTNHTECVLEPEDYFKNIPRLIHLLDDPVADAAAIPLLSLSDQAKKSGVTVMLAGEGSDEMLGGYSKYFNYFNPLALNGLMNQIGGLGSGILQHLISFFPMPIEKKVMWSLAASRGCCYHGHAWETIDDVFMNGDVKEEAHSFLSQNFDTARKLKLDSLNMMLYMDFKIRLPDDMLVRLDRTTMGASIEGRVPFLDHRICEYLFRLPSNLKIHNKRSQAHPKKGCTTSSSRRDN